MPIVNTTVTVAYCGSCLWMMARMCVRTRYVCDANCLRTVDNTVHICTASSPRKNIHLSVHDHQNVKCSFCAKTIVTVTTSSHMNDSCFRALLVSVEILVIIMNSVTEGCDRNGFLALFRYYNSVYLKSL